jgi:uroporphyrinogen-III synthase
MGRELEGLKVVVAEHRYGAQLAQLMERKGATVFACPLMKETAVEDAEGAKRFLDVCETSSVDFIVFYTGVGVDFLFRSFNKPDVIARSKVLARGPKAVAALKRAGVRVDLVADQPTTEGIIGTLSRHDLRGKTVLVQLYGEPNPALTDALEQRGARVIGISLYSHSEASDRKAVRQLVDKILDGEVDAIAFTSGPQVRFLFDAAAECGKDNDLRDRIVQDVVVVSIGEVTGRALTELGLRAQVTPHEPKMGPMVEALASYVEQRRKQCSTPFSSN